MMGGGEEIDIGEHLEWMRLLCAIFIEGEMGVLERQAGAKPNHHCSCLEIRMAVT